MQVVAGWADVDDVDAFLEQLEEAATRYDAVIQAVDARYVAGERHLERAVELARRAIDADDTIADDPGMELLLYVAATRQIHQALEIGIEEGHHPVAIVIDGEREDEAADAVRSLIEPDADAPAPDEERLMDWFGITPAEREATEASLEALVCERVALLVLEA